MNLFLYGNQKFLGDNNTSLDDIINIVIINNFIIKYNLIQKPYFKNNNK